MEKSNKELAVELTKIWVEAYAQISSNPKVSQAESPSLGRIAEAFSFFYDKVSEEKG